MVVATGFFDGVHLGHRHFIRQLAAAAAARGTAGVVLTFWPHPRTVLQDGARNLRLLTSPEEKRRRLLALGVDRVETIPFTRAFSRLSAEDYLKEYVISRYGGETLLLGYDNRLGSDRCGPQEAAAVAERLGIEALIAERYDSPEGIAVSSSKIRRLLADGEVAGAAAMLGYGYELYGVVVSGNRLGREMGFPTANIRLYEPLKLLPGKGVYLVKVRTVGRELYGMCNIGCRPTVSSGGSVSVEVHIFDFGEEIYGLDIRLTFLQRIREERRFPDIPALKRQLAQDREVCRSLLDNILRL